MQRLVFFDFETYRIRAGMAVPRMVCCQYDDGQTQTIVLREEGLRLLRGWLLDPDVTIAGQNVFYDLAVACAEDESFIELVFDAIDAGRVRDLILREKLILNAQGELKYEWDDDLQQYRKTTFGLGRLVWKHLKIFLKGKKKDDGEDDDPWRLRFCELDGIDPAKWPKDAYDYALSDVVYGRAVYNAQKKLIDDEDGPGTEIPGELGEVQAAWALELASVWGARTDPETVAELRREVTIAFDTAIIDAQHYGLVRTNTKRSRDMKAIRARVVAHYNAHGLPIPLTAKGQVSTDRECLTMLKYKSKGVPVDLGLRAVSEVVRLQKLLTTYVPILERGARYPINPHYNTPLETFRTSCSNPNFQNFPRFGAVAKESRRDVRSCFISRDGWVDAFCDYGTLEMRTLAQCCIDFFGYSALAEAFHAGKDVHLVLTSEMLGITYEEAAARYEAQDPSVFGPQSARQYSKIGNYGMGGGMGPDAFMDYARGYGIELRRDEAVLIHQVFRSTWQMYEYFQFCSNLCEPTGEVEKMVFPRSGRVRGNVRYTAVCNGFFQELASAGAKDALYQVSKECYDKRLRSALYGCRVWLFCHDEIGMEIPYRAFGPARAHAAAMRLQAVMIDRMQKWLPGCPEKNIPPVPVEATVVMMRRWFKGGKQRFVDGYLVPVRPEGKDWVPDLEGLMPSNDSQRTAKRATA